MGGANMQQLMRQAQKMQQDMQRTQEELQSREFTATAGGGMVTVKVSGALQLQEVTIDPEAVDPEDVEMLQDMIVAAVNQGIADAQAMVNQRMSAVTGGLGGLF